ncbi:MAG: cobalamin biosynthesis Mg chelatase CobN [Flavobacteriaceae bacterium]|jgi:cobalamin biosynthesis Mg chelatase CobN
MGTLFNKVLQQKQHWLALALLLTLILSSSCTMTKRVHRKGWHVEWHKSKRSEALQSTNSTLAAHEASKFSATDSDEPISVDNSTEEVNRTSNKRHSEIKSSDVKVAPILSDSDTPQPYTEASLETENAPELEEEESVQSQEVQEKKNLQDVGRAIFALILVLIILGAGLGLLLLYLVTIVESIFFSVLLILGIAFFWAIALICLIFLIGAFL